MTKKRVLFLCTGNSCRSQMAEGFVNARMREIWEAYSAGTHPTGYVHPFALQVLDEIGIEHQGRSKAIEEIQGIPFDIVITVCDSAAKECPVWLGSGARFHIGFPDPAKVTGSEVDIIAAFRGVRDDIMWKIPRILERFENS